MLWAPMVAAGDYVRPDGSASVNFRHSSASRELIAGRLEAGAAMHVRRGQGLFGRVGMVLGSSGLETNSIVVAGVPLEYQSQQMFFAFAGGAEFQFADRALGFGLDLGWAATWDPRRETANGLELTMHGSDGPYGRLSAVARLPWQELVGVGIFAALDAYLVVNDWTFGAHGRAAIGVFIELDGSR